MASRAEAALAIFQKRVGLEDGVGNWHKLEQSQINLFADATGDHQFIHVDPEKAAQLSPFKVTIAHGFLTLSLVPFLTGSISAPDPQAYEGLTMGINYGLDKVRFPAPVKVESRVRARRELVAVDLKAENSVQLKQKVTVEIEGEDKPACVAELLTRLVYG
jgi:acyl dehydratase